MSEFTAAHGLTWPLLFAFVAFWLLGVAVLTRVMAASVAIIVTSLKLGISASFFIFWGDGSWFIGGDDAGYFRVGMRLLDSGENPFSIWFSPFGEHHLISKFTVAGYHWWNMILLYVFGTEYGVVVLANASTTFISSLFIYSLARSFGASKDYAQALIVFFLLHWDVLAWSSFLNIKEPLVFLFMITNVWAFVKLERGSWWALIPFVGSLFCLIGLRFYLPALLIGAAAAYLLLFSQRRLFFAPFAVAAVAFVTWRYWYTLSLVDRLVIFDLKVFLLYLLKAVWSPLPWRITEPALYLVIPSFLDLIARPLAFFGMAIVVYRNQCRSAAFIALVVIAGYVFYSLVPPIASVRHLAPFNWLLVGFQFHMFWLLASQFIKDWTPDTVPRWAVSSYR